MAARPSGAEAATAAAAPAAASDDADPRAILAGWREQGLHRLDPVRFHALEAMARRAAQQPEAVRRLLHRRLAVLLRDPPVAPGDAVASPRAGAQAERSAPGPLAELVQRLAAGRVQAECLGGQAHEGDPAEFFRHTWSRLKLEAQLSRSLSQRPRNAGPLNSHRLVLDMLQRLRDTSPGYLGRWMAYLDALFWLEQAGAAAAAAVPDAPTGEAPRRSAGGRVRKKSQDGGRAAS